MSNFYWPIFWFNDPFLTILILFMRLQRQSLFLSVSFSFLVIPFDSVLQFPWLLKLPTWYYMLSFFSTRFSNTLVISHPLFDTNNFCVISEASADDYFLLWCFSCLYMCHIFCCCCWKLGILYNRERDTEVNVWGKYFFMPEDKCSLLSARS